MPNTYLCIPMQYYYNLLLKVPGRMGMLVTLCLISSNVYIAVDAPLQRGFSYIEVWFLGMQLPILFAIVEYSLILGMNKFLIGKDVNVKVTMMGPIGKKVLFSKENMEFLAYFLDLISFLSSAILFIIFCFIYWVSLDS